MRLKGKLIFIFLFLSIVPLVISSGFTIQIVDVEVAQNIRKLHADQIRLEGERLDWVYRQSGQSIREVVHSFDIESLTPEEAQGLLRLIYRQDVSVNGVALVTAQGRLRSKPVYFAPGQKPLPGHMEISVEAMESLIDLDLIKRANTDGLAWGLPVQFEGSPILHMPLAVAASRPLNEKGPVVLAYITLYELISALGPFSQMNDREILLITSSGSVLAKAEGGEVNLGMGERNADQGVLGFLQKSRHADDGSEVTVRGVSGSGDFRNEQTQDAELGAYYDFQDFDLTLVSTTSTDQAYGAIRRIRQETVYWIVIAVLIGLIFTSIFTRTLVGPIGQLAEGVLAIARGQYEQHVEVKTKDEVGELATSFNYMAQELQSQKVQIIRQQDEIQTWNEELQERVEQRTRELKEAQDYLIHTQKLAAVAEISSGVAHELNNPLAVVLGFVQLLSAKHKDDDDGPLLQQVEEHAQRCREIVQHLLSFAEAQVDQGGHDHLNFAEVMGTVLKLFEAYFQSRTIELRNEMPSMVMVYGNRAQLLQASLQLITAIRANIPRSGVLLLKATAHDSMMVIEIAGNQDGVWRGKACEQGSEGDATEARDQAMSQGLSLWLAQKIVTDHEGRLIIDRQGGGTEITLRLHQEAFERKELSEGAPA